MSDGGAGTGESDGGSHNEAGAVVNGSVTFTVDGKKFVADTVSLRKSSSTGPLTLTATRTDPDDPTYFDQIQLVYSDTTSGTDTCGSIVNASDRSVVYGRYFPTTGGTATEKQFVSGEFVQGTMCDFTVTSHAPDSGNVVGTLFNSKTLTGGGSGTASVDIRWSGVTLD